MIDSDFPRTFKDHYGRVHACHDYKDWTICIDECTGSAAPGFRRYTQRLKPQEELFITSVALFLHPSPNPAVLGSIMIDLGVGGPLSHCSRAISAFQGLIASGTESNRRRCMWAVRKH